MLAWIRSPRGSTTTATVVVVLLALFWLAPWQKPLPVRLPFASPSNETAGSGSSGAAPGSTAAQSPGTNPPGGGSAENASPPAAAGSATGSPVGVGRGSGANSGAAGDAALGAQHPPVPATATAGSSSASVAAAVPQLLDAGSVPKAATTATTAVGDAAPTFDVVRIEPSGAAVIAGRAPAGSDVTLLDGEKVLGHITADASGQFAVLPDPLTPGSHYLTLQVRRPDGQTGGRSVQGVAVSVAGDAASKPLVALLAPDRPAQVLSDGSALAAPGGTSKVGPSTPVPVAIQSVEAGDGGRFTASGVAHPGNQCRVYLNGAYLADVTANKDGHWSVEVKKGMRAGKYTVRADEVEAGSGKVLHRAEVPFDFPSSLVAQTGDADRSLMPRPSAETGGQAGTLAAVVANPATMPGAAASQQRSTAADVNSAAAPMPSTASDMAKAAQRQASTATTADASAGAGVATAASTVVIPSLQSATVIRGDSLWRISRKMLGHGIKYTEIYASNATQIRDPALIYPGQIFVVPNKASN